MSTVYRVKVTYFSLRLYLRPLVKEEGDGDILTIIGSRMEGSRSNLQQGHTDRHRLETQEQQLILLCLIQARLHGSGRDYNSR